MVADALQATLTWPDVAARLRLPAGVVEAALAANAAVRTSGTLPAVQRYTGTVYEGLAYDQLSPAAQRLARRACWTFSGLFGVLRGDEPTPDYRVPATADLVGIGPAVTYWRRALTPLAPALFARGLVVDLRSTDYAAMWRVPRTLQERVVPVRVLSPAPDGTDKVISYNSKLAKGRLAAALLESAAAGRPIRSADDIAEVWTGHGGRGARATAAGGLDLYTH